MLTLAQGIEAVAGCRGWQGAEGLPVGVEVFWGGIAKLPGGTEEL